MSATRESGSPSSRPFDPLGPLATGGVLLEASAGTGKTWSITSLVLRLVVEEDVRIENVLAVTFTNAATAELRARVWDRLDEALRTVESYWREDPKPAPDDVIGRLVTLATGGLGFAIVLGRLRAALEGFDRAQIWTIHGFCQRMLQQNALASGVAFDTTLVEDERALVREVVEDFWQRELYAATPATLALLTGVGLDLDRAVSLGDLAIRHPDAEVVPAEPEALPPPAMPKTTAARAALERFWWKDRRRAVAIIKQAAEQGLLHRRFPVAELDGVMDVGDAVVRGALDRTSFFKLRVLDGARLAKSMASGGAPLRHPLFDLVSALRAAWIEEMPTAADYLLSFRYRLIAEVRAAVRRRREASAQRSFDDLLRLLREALEAPGTGAELAASIRKQFRAVLIDEFQDTDPVQWAIFDGLFVAQPRHWLYLIGDPKQAIYRFRGADIDTYLAAKRALGGRIETLARSYRSDARLVQAQNVLFDTGPAAFATRGIDYERVAAQHADRAEGIGAPLRLLFVRRNRHREIDAKWRDNELPRRVAADIASLLHKGGTLRAKASDEPRPVRPRDCAVLVRTNRQATAIQDALRDVGVPSVLHGPDSVFGTVEAQELERLLAAILEPARTRLARTALATGLLGGTAVTIAEAAADPQRWEAWVGELRGWLRGWQERGVVHLLRTLVAGRLSGVLARVDGERCMANLLHLTELLHNAEVGLGLDPAGVLEWLRRARRDADDDDASAALRLESDAEAVEIVTIHKSKGLEYPLVWCPYLGLPDSGRTPPAYLHFRDPGDDHGEKLDVAPERREWAGHQQLVSYELAAEGLRLLYVALTRAKHQVTVWWGGFRDAHRSPLWYALHRGAAEVFDAEALERFRERTVRDVTDDQLLAELSTLATRSEHTIAVVEDLPREVPRYEVIAHSDVTLAPLRYDRATPIENGWRRTSFTGLTRHVDYHVETAQAAEDETALEVDEGSSSLAELAVTPVTSVPLADLPGGRGTGNFLHEVLEHVDFQGSAEALRALVVERLPRHGIDEGWAELVTVGLGAALGTPLHAGEGAPCLADLPTSRRLNELGFTFPLAHGGGTGAGRARPRPLSPERLAEVFARHPEPGVPRGWIERLRALSFLPARGFVTGAIDLVFEGEDGRFYVVDYKSNHLGARPADYDTVGMERAMAAHHYFLQYHLYTVAAVRYLRTRIPDFAYERHFGGVYYLFLRGMAPGHPAGTGVFAATPPESLIADLSDALDGLVSVADLRPPRPSGAATVAPTGSPGTDSGPRPAVPGGGER